jgi:hypothetical protein
VGALEGDAVAVQQGLAADADRPGSAARWSASLRIDQRAKGLPSVVGRAVAVWMTRASSSVESRLAIALTVLPLDEARMIIARR